MRTLKCVLSACLLSLAAAHVGAADVKQEQAEVEAWHQGRIAALTDPAGWLTLVGLYWLREGDNTVGRASSNLLELKHKAAPDRLGTFKLKHGRVTFIAKSHSAVTHDGQRVRSIEMLSDASGDPTVLNVGSLEFFVIERGGQVGVRVRDAEHPARKQFLGVERFPVSMEWVIDAKFEAYDPIKHIEIINILGIKELLASPGAVTFIKDGKEHRLDVILEAPDDKDLFVMFADATSGHETYGAGRYMRIPMPSNNRVTIDFNKSYNPPCAFTDFATCPLPPWQNRLPLRVEAGEKSYLRDHAAP